MCQIANERKPNSNWLEIVNLSVHIRATLGVGGRASGISNSVDPGSKCVIENVGSFCLVTHRSQRPLPPEPGSPCVCEMAVSGIPGYCVLTRFAVR